MSENFAIVTGTSRGLGLAVAGELLSRGWTVLGVARSAAPSQLAGAEGYSHAAVDLADSAAVEAVLGPVTESSSLAGHGRIALVNNAGLLDIAPIHKLDLAATGRSLAVNAAVPAWLAGRVLAGAATSARVRIVDVSSGAATSAYPGWGAYCASKAALRMFGQVLALEHEELDEHRGLDVGLVSYSPGVVDTTMQGQIRTAALEDFPRRARFEALHADGELVDAALPAREIAELLEADRPPLWQERRFGA
ncbi:SDR family NAD(P)-dependent oxidoreductase [Engelhardtia mirabilis]|uniref:Benzil reductase ((S)-benzoin forming) n=1 Tax=Engelhardtia mirabilis TaxID=2528011 RepID=A0A518BLN5_9BACT|nr:Benzil reductase ((S)-benzoin forming) [Planctomycetes bacterium Pla133]QDV02199.1 Benzil reductase ((S)-benzoin forming) [Planctomycetes bacterium Pla86]